MCVCVCILYFMLRTWLSWQNCYYVSKKTLSETRTANERLNLFVPRERQTMINWRNSTLVKRKPWRAVGYWLFVQQMFFLCMFEKEREISWPTPLLACWQLAPMVQPQPRSVKPSDTHFATQAPWGPWGTWAVLWHSMVVARRVNYILYIISGRIT